MTSAKILLKLAVAIAAAHAADAPQAEISNGVLRATLTVRSATPTRRLAIPVSEFTQELSDPS